MAAIPDSQLPGHLQVHERVVTALGKCREERDTEFKESRPWGDLKDQIARTALGLTNLRDGGMIIVGVSERGGVWTASGIIPDHLKTYDEDDANDYVNRFASPQIRLGFTSVRHEDRTFLAIEVPEFADCPVVCRRDGPKGSRIEEGAVYHRPTGKPETRRIRTADDLVGILELAAEKRARSMLAAGLRVGLVLPTPARNAFDAELEGL